jgi:thiamine-monophosphate kinase
VDIKEIGESGLIQRIADNYRSSHPYNYRSSHPSIISGIGEDAAALKISKQNILLTTCDLLLEDIHFNLSLTDSYHLGRKSLAVNLSDIAAMGGTPCFFLVSLAIQPHLSVKFIDDLYRGMMELADEFHTQLVGGDTNSSPNKLMIDITLLGEANPDHLLKRSGAQAGDSIFVTGTLGDAALGFFILETEKKLNRPLPLNTMTSKHLSPYPRIKEGKSIADNQLASAMIDISDGLLADLRRILTLSKAGATIWISQLPLSREFKHYQGQLKHNKIDFALKGGEDYELLFTSPQTKEKELSRLSQELGVPINKIGEVNSSEKIVVLDQNQKPYPVDDQGYDHFSSISRQNFK